MKRSTFFIWTVCITTVIMVVYIYLIRHMPDNPCSHHPLSVSNDVAVQMIHHYETVEPELEKKRVVQQEMAIALPPEVERLQSLLNEFKQDASKWDHVVAIGDIYRKGAFPRLLPNEELALECYKVASMCPDGTVAGDAQLKYIEARNELISSHDKAGSPLPTYIADEVCSLAMKRISTTPQYMFEKPVSRKPPQRARTEQPIIQNVPIIHETENIDINNLFDVVDTGYDFDLDNVQVMEYHNDSQNVHDHSVVGVTKKNIDMLREKGFDKHVSDAEKDILDKVLTNTDMTAEEKSNAVKVLESLSRETHSTFDMSEVDTLNLVWNKIQSVKNPENKSDLSLTLCRQLASGVENGYVVCSTGKITRMLGTFDGQDDVGMETVKPMWAVKEEMSNLASRIRESHLANMTETIRKSYENGDRPDIENDMKTTFEREAKELYIDKLGLQSKIINPMIEQISEGF